MTGGHPLRRPLLQHGPRPLVHARRPAFRRCHHHPTAASVVAVLAAGLLMAGVVPAPGASAAATRTKGRLQPVSAHGIAGWTLVGSQDENSGAAGEGVATVTRPGHGTTVLYRGFLSVPKGLAADGWTHIGDPDSAGGYVVDAYQGPSSGNSKMFLVTTPSGRTFRYVHRLVRGEIYNNSFAAISPDRQWLVAGEWHTMRHLQVYRAPLLNRRTPRHGGRLPLAGAIELDHRVNDIQSCDFLTARRLLCASDDDRKTLSTNEKPLLEVDLAHRLRTGDVEGHVVDLGSIPQRGACTGSGAYEAEGVDYDAGDGSLRVEVTQPGHCIITTTVYRYVRQGARRHRGSGGSRGGAAGR